MYRMLTIPPICFLQQCLILRVSYTALKGCERMHLKFVRSSENRPITVKNISTHASLNHGFASHIVHVLYRDVLGIANIDVENKTVSFRIPEIDLAFCRGATPRGDEIFEFEWEKDGDTILFRHFVPDGYKIDIQNETRYNISRN